MTDWQPIETAPKDGTEIIRGWISERDVGDSDDVIFVSDDEIEPLAERLSFLNKKLASVRYWTSDEEADDDELKLSFLAAVSGVADVRFRPNYSEITGYLWTDEDLNVGGHNLLSELRSLKGKWVLLEIDWKDPPPRKVVRYERDEG